MPGINKEIIRRALMVSVLLFVIIFSDQLSKSIIRQKVEYNERISIIDNFITMTKVENTGAFLSLGNHLSKGAYLALMVVAPLLVIAYALYYLVINNTLSGPVRVGICFITGGGLGNIIDRILYGSVTDYLHFNFVIFQTGIVNLADMILTAGFFILLFTFIFQGKKHKTQPI